jgi:hypothetical protein
MEPVAELITLICTGCYVSRRNSLFLETKYAKGKAVTGYSLLESADENVAGTSLPSELGQIFRFPPSIHSMGARIARTLREFGFVAGVFDHLYLNFTRVVRHCSRSRIAYSR